MEPTASFEFAIDEDTSFSNCKLKMGRRKGSRGSGKKLNKEKEEEKIVELTEEEQELLLAKKRKFDEKEEEDFVIAKKRSMETQEESETDRSSRSDENNNASIDKNTYASESREIIFSPQNKGKKSDVVPQINKTVTVDGIELNVRMDEDNFSGSSDDSEIEEDEQVDLNESLDSEPEKTPRMKFKNTRVFTTEEKRMKELKSDPTAMRLIKQLASELQTKGKKNLNRNSRQSNCDKLKTANCKKRAETEIVKSPSDTTVYVPALKQKLIQEANTSPKNRGTVFNTETISNILDQMRAEIPIGDNAAAGCSHWTGNEEQPTRKGMQSIRANDDNTAAKERANELMRQAERFRAEVSAPPGRNQTNNFPIQNDNNFMAVPPVDYSITDSEDAEFSNATCHVDMPTESKIARGQFLEVEKLAPKYKGGKFKPDDQKRMELVNRDGMSYFVPAVEKDEKINSFSKWEQCFRVYAAIYCKYNPHRGAEIWQYVHNLSIAAATFTWENVANYDYMFRQMMAKKPQRSWGKTNTQLWTLTMKDRIVAGQNYNQNNVKKPRFGDWRDNCCWRYNRNKCKKQNCRFDHKCSYCGSYSHIFLHCNKRKSKGSAESSGANKDSKS